MVLKEWKLKTQDNINIINFSWNFMLVFFWNSMLVADYTLKNKILKQIIFKLLNLHVRNVNKI